MAVNHIWKKYALKFDFREVNYGKISLITSNGVRKPIIGVGVLDNGEAYYAAENNDAKEDGKIPTDKLKEHRYIEGGIVASYSDLSSDIEDIPALRAIDPGGWDSYTYSYGKANFRISNYELGYAPGISESVSGTCYVLEAIKNRGAYISTVKSSSRYTYPDNGEQGGYYYAYQGVDNQPPTISGSNLDLGSKQDDFEIEYTVSDPDKNPCTVDIIVDTVKKISSKSVVLNTKYTYPVKIDEFSLGKHTITITAKDSNGATTSRKYTFTKSNTAPVISGSDTDLGEKSTAFTEEYSVTDRNNDNVDITVTLDDLEISNISSAQNKSLSFTISNEQLLKFEIGSSHTITIKADDGKGGVAYRRYTFIKANRPPIISDTDKDLGQKKESFSVNYSLSDVEKDKIYTRIYLDNKQVFENLEVVDGKSYQYTLEKDVFLSLNYGKHEIRIEAWDDNSVNNKQVRIYTFERVQDGLIVEIKINEFDIQPKKIIAVPHGIFASDASIMVLACNNYNDTKPKWESITESSKAARAYSFTNTTKTASKWAIGVKIMVRNGKSGVSSLLRGVKGGYE